MRTLQLAIVIAICCGGASGQTRLRIDQIELCSYYGETIRDDLYAFESDQEAQSIVADIMRTSILPQNFSIKAANVPNAAAVIRDAKRLILYNQSFVRDINREAGTDWAAKSILAHEIGHHLAGHTLDTVGSRPDTELQADKFSGGTLYRLRATLEEAKSAMQIAGDSRGSSTHPPKSARLAAIHNGWIAAQELDQTSDSEPKPPIERKPPPRQDPVEPEPRRRRNTDINGIWRHSSGVMTLSYTGSEAGSDMYGVTDQNAYGVVGRGVAVVKRSNAMLRVNNLIAGITYTCALLVSGPQMSGLCNVPTGHQWQLYLGR